MQSLVSVWAFVLIKCICIHYVIFEDYALYNVWDIAFFALIGQRIRILCFRFWLSFVC